MSAPCQFRIRDAGLVEGDDSFIISVFDASLPYLESIGSLAQWGSTPFSQRPGWIKETQQQIQDSEFNRMKDTVDGLRIRIIEAELVEQETVHLSRKDIHSRVMGDGRYFASVGFAFVRGDWLSTYIPAAIIEQFGRCNFEKSLYIEVMICDHRTKDLFREVGAALLQEVRRYGHSRGKKVVYLDGWAENEQRLLHYYEQQGFHIAAKFSLSRRHKEVWVGSLMQLKI